MKPFALLIAFLLGSVLSRSALLGQEYDARDSAEWMREADFSFSLSRPEDVNRLFKVCRIGVLEATLTLEKLSRKEYTRDDDEPIRAAKVLLIFRGGGPRGLAALCSNIRMKGGGGSEAAPLDDFFVAQGLAGIGGRAVRGAIFDSLRGSQDWKGLMLKTHVLAQMEPPSVMQEHIRLAVEDQERREKSGGIPVDENYKHNLRRMGEWLKDPKFLDNPNNWP